SRLRGCDGRSGAVLIACDRAPDRRARAVYGAALDLADQLACRGDFVCGHRLRAAQHRAGGRDRLSMLASGSAGYRRATLRPGGHDAMKLRRFAWSALLVGLFLLASIAGLAWFVG